MPRRGEKAPTKETKEDVQQAEDIQPPEFTDNEQFANWLINLEADELIHDLDQLAEDDDKMSRIKLLEYEVNDESFRVLYLPKLLVGYRHSDQDFYKKVIETTKSLPEDQHPHMLVLSGFLPGDYKLTNKSGRDTLRRSPNQKPQSMGWQYEKAREMIELAGGLGVPMIYNLGPAEIDSRGSIAYDSTVDVMRNIEADRRAYEKKDKAYQKKVNTDSAAISVSALDRIRRDKRFDEHMDFQRRVVIPYCIRSGRRLFTAAEMAQKTEGKIQKEEYYVLLAESVGSSLSSAEKDWLRSERKKQIPEETLEITRNFNLSTTTIGAEYNDKIVDNVNFSGRTLPKNHMVKTMTMQGQLVANGKKSEDLFAKLGDLDTVYVGHDEGERTVMTATVGGFVDASEHLEIEGGLANSPLDIAMRSVRMRGRIHKPTTSMHERTDDGRHIITFFNDHLIEKMHSYPERITIVVECDDQIGSSTARMDMYAKKNDYVRTRILGERAVYYVYDGDHQHGRNYSHFPSESQLTGLMSMDSQEEMHLRLLRGSFEGMTRDELKSIYKVKAQPGNHEWNSGTLKWHGSSFMTGVREFWGRMYAREGYTDKQIDEIVGTDKAIKTPRGDYITGGFTGIEYLGDIGVLNRHYLLERGGKGSNSDLPVFQAHEFLAGAGVSMKDIDIVIAGHWHHPQAAVLVDKLSVVGGAMAGKSDYELTRAYDPTIASVFVHVGGGQPPQVEILTKQTLDGWKIQKGAFTDERLREENPAFFTDEGFNPAEHGIYLPEGYFPKDALQKKILHLQREVSQDAYNYTELR